MFWGRGPPNTLGHTQGVLLGEVLLRHLYMVEQMFTDMLSLFVILQLICIFIYKKTFVSAGYIRLPMDIDICFVSFNICTYQHLRKLINKVLIKQFS